MPLPFGRGVFVYGEPIAVPPGADRGTMELKRRELEQALLRLTAEAEALARGPAARGRDGSR